MKTILKVIVLILIGLLYSGCSQQSEEKLMDYNNGKPVFCYNILSKIVLDKNSWKYSSDLKSFYNETIFYNIKDCWTRE